MISLKYILNNPIVQRLGWALFHSLWQCTLIAILFAVCLLALRKTKSGIRYNTALTALLLMVIIPAVTIFTVKIPEPAKQVIPVQAKPKTTAAAIHTPSAEITGTIKKTAEFPTPQAAPAVTASAKPAAAKTANLQSQTAYINGKIESALPYLALGWLIGVFVLSICQLGGWEQLHKRRRIMTKSVEEHITSKLAELSEALAVKRTIEVFQSALVNVPTVIGAVRPVILLPASVLTGLSPDQLEAILAHELAHIKRHDYLVNLIQTALEILLFYHPAAWYISRKIRTERENCCDDIAVRITGDRLKYAKALTTLEELKTADRRLAVAATGGNFFSRVSRLISKDDRQKSKPSWLTAAITMLVIAAVTIPSTLAISSKTKNRISENKTEKMDDSVPPIFKTTLPNDIEIELVGLCSGFTDQQRLWWHPDGQAMEDNQYKKYNKDIKPMTWNDLPGRQFKYAYLYKAAPLENVTLDSGISAGDRWHEDIAKDHIRIGYVYSDSGNVSDFPETGLIKIAAAGGTFKEITSKLYKSSVNDSTTLDDKTTNISISGPRIYPEYSEKMLDVNITSNEYDVKVVCQMENGKKVDALPSSRMGGPGITSFHTDSKTLIRHSFRIPAKWDNIEKIIIKYRKFEVATFKNVSLKSRHKTNVEIEALEHIRITSNKKTENLIKPESRMQKLTFDENCTLKRALSVLGELYEVNIIPANIDSNTFVPVTNLYNLNLEEAIEAIIGNNKYVKDGNLIRIYTQDEYARLYSSEKKQIKPIKTKYKSQAVSHKYITLVMGDYGILNGKKIELPEDIPLNLAKVEDRPNTTFQVVLTEDLKKRDDGQTLKYALLAWGKEYGFKEVLFLGSEKSIPISTKNDDADDTIYVTVIISSSGMIIGDKKIEKPEDIPTALAALPQKEKTVIQMITPADIHPEDDWHATRAMILAWAKEYGIKRVEFPTEKKTIKHIDPSWQKPAIPTGNPLQELIDNSNPDTIITVPKGTYTKPVRITKPLTLKGESKDKCIIEVTANAPAVFIDTASKGEVKVEGLTIKWKLATSDRIEYSSALAVKDCKALIKDCTFLPLGNFRQSPTAARSYGFSNMTVDSCRFDGFDYTVCFSEATEGAMTNSVITNCKSQGVILYNGSKADVTGNIIVNSGKHAVRSTGGNLNMLDNLIMNNANRGVYLGNKTGTGRLINNALIKNSAGISGFASADVKIENNVILDSEYSALGIRGSCRLSIRDNIIKGNPRGIAVYSDHGENYNKIGINTFHENKADAENVELPKDSIQTDPRFKDPENGDFSLEPGPALQNNQGLGNPRVIKKLWDKYRKLTARHSLQTQTGKAGKLSKVKEFIIPKDSPIETIIDFETGKTVTIPDEIRNSKDPAKLMAWTIESGVDASIKINNNLCYMGLTNSFALQIDNDRWQSTSSEEISNNQQLIGGPLNYENITKKLHDLPRTYLLKTYQGSMGIFQILYFTDSFEGVKIVYRIIEKT